ncbi:MAG: SAM-dependent methyltransferase [Chitinophagales bacterium]|nr:SAM-dependent methyltransferase [Chitinophagales bacterium]
MDKKTQFLDKIKESIAKNTFIKMNFSAYFGTEIGLKNAYLKPIILKEKLQFQCVYRFKTRDITKNFSQIDCMHLIEQFLNKEFKNAVLFTTENDWNYENINEEKIVLKKVKPSIKGKLSLKHDKEKNRIIIAEGKHYLQQLEITNKDGLVLKNAQDKYRQINRYVEILRPLIDEVASDDILKVVDMGAGKGYLTFALYDYLVNVAKRKAEVSGIEFRPDMVKLCNQIAMDSDFKDLKFEEGTIQSYECDSLNVLIALHACDTATDEAIFKGITKSADLIVVAPCCHKQIRREMEKGKPANDLDFLLKHGIFLERQAEMITDGIRALILEYFGYKTKIFEFISDVHTPKNIMITAQKLTKNKVDKAAILEKIKTTKAYFGIETHYLETLIDLE